MNSKEISGIGAIAIASSILLLLGPGLLTPVFASATIAPATPRGGPVYIQPQLQTLSSRQSMVITGTFKVVSSVVLSKNITNGIAITVTKSTIARNDSTSPEVVTSMITITSVSRVDNKTGNGTSTALGTLTGTIAGFGPGVCIYRGLSILTAQGTPKASSESKHWISDCTGTMAGISDVTTSIGKGAFTSIITFDWPTAPAHAPQQQHTTVPC